MVGREAERLLKWWPVEVTERRTGRPSRLAVVAMVLAVLVGLGVRAAYATSRQDDPLQYDAPEYVGVAHRLAEGEGFTWPFRDHRDGTRAQTAFHPPLTALWLTIPTAAGVDTVLGLMVWHALAGTLTIAVVALVGRELAGDAGGVAAAWLAALHPGLWSQDAQLQAETPAQLAVALVLWTTYRLIRHARAGSGERLALDAALAGGAAGLAALARAELALLVPLVVAPALLGWRRRPPIGARPRSVAVGAAALWCGVLVLPWVGWNLTRFEEPVLLTTGMDITLAQTNCPPTWYGDLLGYRETFCGGPVDAVFAGRSVDESELGRRYRQKGLAFVDSHRDRIPVVVAARVGRSFGLWEPFRQAELESSFEGRDRAVSVVATVAWWALAPLAVGGMVLLRRQHTVVYPLAGPFVAATTASALAFGSSRFRAPAEVAAVVAAAVVVAAVVREPSRRRSPR